MAAPLKKDTPLPWGPKNDEEAYGDDADEDGDATDEPNDDSSQVDAPDADADPSTDSSDAASDEDVDEEGSDEDKEVEPVVIDLEGFESRVQLLPADPGRIAGLLGLEGKFLYLRRARNGSGDSGTSLMIFDPSADDAKERDKLVLADVDDLSLNAKRDKILVRSEGKWGVINAAADQKLEDPIDLSELHATIDPREEWEQMVMDAWRLFRDFFYDAQMHGVDWDAIGQRTIAALDDATSREDVHFLIGEMIAELNVGHAYNRSPQSGIPTAEPAQSVGLLGCDWLLDDGIFRIKRILHGGDYDADARSPLARPGVDVREGDYLLAVNGNRVDTSRDVYASFLGMAAKPTLLTVNDKPTFDGNEREALVLPEASESSLRYRDWVRQKREQVTRTSGGRVGYVHVPDTGANGQNELFRQFLGQQHNEALIVDERWNGGGQIPTRFIELLDRPLTNFWAVRDGEDWDWPPVGHRGPKAMLINHSSGSGGDAFPYYFKQAGLGKLIGTRTWGGLVGISGNPGLIDGAAPSVPRFAFYELDGTWGVEGHGVEPDIEVIDDPAKMLNGEDPQLDAAIQELLGELESWPFVEKRRPAAPDRSGAGLPSADQ